MDKDTPGRILVLILPQKQRVGHVASEFFLVAKL